jgi:hypothetical protein
VITRRYGIRHYEANIPADSNCYDYRLPIPDMPYLTIAGPEIQAFTLILKLTGEKDGEYRRVRKGEVRDGPDRTLLFRSLTII